MTLTIIILIFIVGIIGYILYLVWNSSSQIQLAFITVTGSATGIIYSHFLTRKREIDARQFSYKSEAYRKVFSMIMSTLKGVKNNKDITQENSFIDQVFDVKEQFMIWASSETLDKWIEFENYSQRNYNNPHGVLLILDRLLRAMRKDLGHNDKTLSDGAMIKFFLTPESRDDFDKFIDQR